jgi:hypothetical protein
MLAVCVDDSDDKFGFGRPSAVCKDQVYCVDHVGEYQGYIGLALRGVPDAGFGYLASRFRPAVQDDQACDEDFRALLKRSKPAKAPVLTPNRHERAGYINSQSTSARPLHSSAGAADCMVTSHARHAVGTHSGPDSSDHALCGLADSYDCHRSAS